jgi:hypothetical protein
MERTGIEPVTSGLQSRAEGNYARRQTTTNNGKSRMATRVAPPEGSQPCGYR